MALAENLETGGFQVTKKVFINPSNTTLLDSVAKRKITICNLFANHYQSISDIVRILDEKYAHVVHVLMEQGLILERRQHPRQSVPAEGGRLLFRRV